MDHTETTPATNGSESAESENAQALQLSDIELRVLGALMEKQLTTPDSYPLTLNSLANACNQKSNREPVTNYHEGELKRCLQELEDKNFIRVEPSSRSYKYSQDFIKQLDLNRKHQALLCVMMLRGPQTLSELDTRTQRMGVFTDREDLEHHIERLCVRSTPYAARLSQKPGQRGERICHLFSDTPANATAVSRQETALQPLSQDTRNPEEQPAQADKVIHLENQVTSLQTLVNVLESEVEELRDQLKTLYQLTGHR